MQYGYLSVVCPVAFLRLEQVFYLSVVCPEVLHLEQVLLVYPLLVFPVGLHLELVFYLSGVSAEELLPCLLLLLAPLLVELEQVFFCLYP